MQEKFADDPSLLKKFPHKFLREYIQSVLNLHKHGKDNLIYFLVKCEQDYLQWQETMYAKFGVQRVCMHRGPAWEYEEESLDDSDHIQPNVDAGTSINEDQADSVITTGSCGSSVIIQNEGDSVVSQEDCIVHVSPQPGLEMDILSQAKAFTGITESAVDIDDWQLLHHVNQTQLFLKHQVYCGLLTKAEVRHRSNCGEEQTRIRSPTCMVFKVKQLQPSQ